MERKDDKYYIDSMDRRTSEEKWSCIISELHNTRTLAERICAYCNTYTRSKCPLRVVCDGCGGDGTDYFNFRSAVNEAIRHAVVIHKAIIEDLRLYPEKGGESDDEN